MSQVSFTPGPWQVKHPEHHPWEVIANIDGPDDGRFHYDSICDCDQDSKSKLDSEETKANARLIAAAPEMYEALEATAEALAVSLGRLGVCGEGDAKDHRADAESFGGSRALGLARTALAKADGAQ